MAVLFYDQINREVDDKGRYIPNWNEDGDYKEKEYARVFFRLDSGYDWSRGWEKPDKERFYQAVSDMFAELGWEIIGDTYAQHGNEGLYLHPMDISGIVQKKNIKVIAEAMEDVEVFDLRCVDVYNDVYEMSDKEYTDYLKSKHDEVVDYLLHNFGTTRRNKMFYRSGVCEKVGSRIKLERVGNERHPWHEKEDNMESVYVSGVIAELVKKGYMVEANNGDMVRTINKTEQRKLKLVI